MLDKLLRIYTRGDIFRAYIGEKNIFPLEIKLKKVTQREIQANFSGVVKNIQKLKDIKLPLVYREFNFKAIGKQSFPISVRFERLDEFLEYIDKKDEYGDFVKVYQKTVALYPSLGGLFFKKPSILLDYGVIWDKILRVIEFFVQNRVPDIYVRELSIEGIDTKFIEKHKKILDLLLCNILHVEPLNSISNYAFEKRYNLKYPLPQIRFRILDKRLFIYGLSDLSVTVEEFKGVNIKCKRVFIVENKITFLSFFDIKDSIVIFGGGYGLSSLKEIEWLKNIELYYWGDIDEDGFAILSQARGYFAHIKSLMMDAKTIEVFKSLKVEHNNMQKQRILSNLTKEESVIYKRLQNDYYGKNFRLEQEKIPFDYAKSNIGLFYHQLSLKI